MLWFKIKHSRYPGLTAGLILIFFLACTPEQDSSSHETLVARVGAKSISLNEFIRRAEYTIRPLYCRSDNYIHRKIVLNSLLAEKLLALEAGADNELSRNEHFQDYLQGRQEQAMRQWFYKKEIYDRVELDTSELKESFSLAGRTYQLSFFNVENEAQAGHVRERLNRNPQEFETVFSQIHGNVELPTREANWKSLDDDRIHAALFNPDIESGEILGPIRIGKDQHMFIRIDSWEDEIILNESAVQTRISDVREILTEREAMGMYADFIGELMKGKRVEFDPQTFPRLVKIVGREYFKTEEDKQDAFNKRFWNKDNEEMVLDDMSDLIEDILQEKILTIDDQVWTVEDLEKAMSIHPLVFRKRKMHSREFAEQFKLAVVDLIRDQHVTNEAYDKGYDRVSEVKRNVSMWEDNMLALYQKEQYLREKGVSPQEGARFVKQHLDPYVGELLRKYDTQIEINTDAFEQVKLTSIDMFVVQTNVPFPIIVPSFPQVTTHDKLDYGQKMSVGSN